MRIGSIGSGHLGGALTRRFRAPGIDGDGGRAAATR